MRYQYFKQLLLICFIGYVLAGCEEREKPPKLPAPVPIAWDKTIPGNFSAQSTAVFDSIEIDSFFKSYPKVIAYNNEVKAFYSNRKFAYAWFDNSGLIEQAGNLANRVMNLQNDGVYKTIPYQKELDSLLTVAADKKQPNIISELMLTAQYFAFSKVAWQGLNTSASRSSGWFLPRKKLNYNQYLDSLLKKPAKQFAADEPVYRQYDLLKSFLRKYRALDTSDKWLPIVIKKKLKPGDSSLIISQVKLRLYKLEDFRGDTLSNLYDDTLLNAVKQFQQRHGLLVNGLLNKPTMAQMNVPLKSRIRQILVNMERSRWLPVSLSAEHLAVNIPEFKLHVYQADSLLWSCDVVVGQTVHQTTVFYGEIKYIVFSPYWNVPPSIVRNEVLPGIRRNRHYMAKHNMETIGREDGLPLIRQKPGPENSLGLVKFLFPNSYNIYLHDTPSKSLFGETARAFSHGCIRVFEPEKLANFLLKNDTVWDAGKINKAMHSGNERTVTLTQKVPVFIAYFTAFTDRNSRLNFRKDIYDRDEHLASMIMAGNGKY